MRCNEITYKTYTNLQSGNSKSCTNCGQKKISSAEEQDVYFELQSGMKISEISKKYNLDRGVINRIKRNFDKYK